MPADKALQLTSAGLGLSTSWGVWHHGSQNQSTSRSGLSDLEPDPPDRAATMVRGSLSHLDLTVTDMARSVRFYERVLGGLGYNRLPEAGADGPCWGVTDADGGVFNIGLQLAKPESTTRPHDRYAPGLHHLAFHADSRGDVDRLYQLLQEIQATILDAPAEYAYTPGYYAVFFADPDGLKLEVVHEPALRGRAG